MHIILTTLDIIIFRNRLLRLPSLIVLAFTRLPQSPIQTLLTYSNTHRWLLILRVGNSSHLLEFVYLILINLRLALQANPHILFIIIIFTILAHSHLLQIIYNIISLIRIVIRLLPLFLLNIILII